MTEGEPLRARRPLGPWSVSDERTLDVARKVLNDMNECARLDLRWLPTTPRVPALVVVFEHPSLLAKPALAVQLTSLATGSPLRDDTLRRLIRESVEKYLHKHGVKLTESA